MLVKYAEINAITKEEVMYILKKKLSLPFHLILLLRYLIAFTSVLVFAVIVTLLFPIVTGHVLKSDGNFSTMVTIILSAELLLIILWRIFTYKRRDLERVMKQEGVRLKKQHPIFLRLQSHFFSSFPHGVFGDSFVIAKITGAYNLPMGLTKMVHITSEDVLTDRIDLSSLISSPVIIDEEIRIEKTSRKIPNTGIPEIDIVLRETLRDADDFRARLLFNKEYFRLIVISSPWLGGRYERRVVKGFRIFKKIDEALRKKYPHKKWEGVEMQWNGSKYEFEPRRISES